MPGGTRRKDGAGGAALRVATAAAKRPTAAAAGRTEGVTSLLAAVCYCASKENARPAFAADTACCGMVYAKTALKELAANNAARARVPSLSDNGTHDCLPTALCDASRVPVRINIPPRIRWLRFWFLCHAVAAGRAVSRRAA